MLKTVYIHTKNNAIQALRKLRKLLARGFMVMWVAEHKISLIKI